MCNRWNVCIGFQYLSNCSFGLLFPVTQLCFCLLIVKNLKSISNRVQPVTEVTNVSQNGVSKRNVTLIKLVVAEIIVSVILTTMYPLSILYTTLSSNVMNKSADRIAIESFVSFLSLIVLHYLNYCVTFYVYYAVSKPFRKSIRKSVLKIIKRGDQHR